LAEAYRLLRKRDDFPPARLEVAGYLAPEHKGYLHEIEREMHEWGFAGEFHYHGALDREAKLRFFQNIDVLSVPATYAEAKGLSVIEAMASGVPVAQPAEDRFLKSSSAQAADCCANRTTRRAWLKRSTRSGKTPNWRTTLRNAAQPGCASITRSAIWLRAHLRFTPAWRQISEFNILQQSPGIGVIIVAKFLTSSLNLTKLNYGG